MGLVGVIRKIDELGRITLPKDMRKKLKIKEDEFIELVYNKDSIIIKKHLPMESKHRFHGNYAEAIHMETGKNVAISDRDRIVAAAGSNEFKKKYMNKSVSVHLDEIIQDRCVIKSEKHEDIMIADGVKETSRCVIAPICTEENAIGTVIICSDCEGEELDDFHVKTCAIAANVLGKHALED